MEIRRSQDHLISAMGFPVLVRQHLYIESGPRAINKGLLDEYLTDIYLPLRGE